VPNHVTYLSLAGNIAGLALMASGSREWMAGGVVLLLVSLVLDAADGNMARTMQRFSPFGEWLEGVGAYLLAAGFHLAGGWGAWMATLRGAPVTAWPATADQAGVLVVLGAVAAGSLTLSILIAAKFSVVFPSVDRGLIVARKGQGAYGLLFTVGRNLSFVSGLCLPLTLLGIWFRRYELVLGGFTLINLGVLVAIFARCWWAAARKPAGQPTG